MCSPEIVGLNNDSSQGIDYLGATGRSARGASSTEKTHSICSKYILMAGLALTSLLTGVGLALATGLLGGVAVIAVANPLIAINAVAVLVIAGVVGLIAASILALRFSK